MSMIDDPYKELAAAIIKSAVLDYERVYRHYLRRPDSQKAAEDVEREKKFFYSQWFEMLSDMDGPKLVSMIEMKVKADLMKKGGAAG